MLFALICTDKPDGLGLRQQTRPAHLAYMEAHAARLVEVGPLLDEAGAPRGSLIVLEAADRAAAEAFAAADPYAQAGLFAHVAIHPYRGVFRAGARLP